MHDPVVVSDGHTYERRHIERWLQEHSTSPVSNEELPENAVFPNHALRNAISEYFDQVFSVHRRAIRKSIRGGEQQRLGSNEPLLHTIDALMQCSFVMNADVTTEVALRQIMDEAKTLVGADAASVFLVDANKQELYSTVNSTGKEISIPITSGIAGNVATTGEPLIIGDAYADERFNKSHDMKTGFRTHNILCVPLKLKKGTVIGVVQLINKSGAGVFSRSQAFAAIAEESSGSSEGCRPAFTAHDLQFLQVFATQAATAVSNSGGVLRHELHTQHEAKDADMADVSNDGLDQSSKLKVVFPERQGDAFLRKRPVADQTRLCDDTSKQASKTLWADIGDSDSESEADEANDAGRSEEIEEQYADLGCAVVKGDPDIVMPKVAMSSPAQLEENPASDETEAVRHTAPRVDVRVALVLNEALRGWQFDALALAELTDNKPLSTLGMYLFEHLGLVQHFGLDPVKLGNFFVEIENGYDDANPYHNRAHAASVMHAMYALLEHGAIADMVAPAFEDSAAVASRGKHGHLQKLACLLAAAVHDHEHLGVTNEFLVRTHHPRATLYNDQHVNENHHCASAFAVLQQTHCNFLNGLHPEDFRQLRSIVIELVIGTDMADGGKIQKAFGDAFGVPAEGCLPSQAMPASAQDAMLLLKMAIKCADLGHLTLAWDVHCKWVARAEAELFAQGDAEKAAGLPVSFVMDRNQPGVLKSQVGFFQFVVLPLLRAFCDAAPSAQRMLDAAVANYCRWQDLDKVAATDVKPCTESEEPSDAPVRTVSKASTAETTTTTQVGSDAVDSTQVGKKKSGRARQRAAKYWATVRCRTPSPEPFFHSAQRC